MGQKSRLPFLREVQWKWRWMQNHVVDAGLLHRIKKYSVGGSHAACDKVNMGIGVKQAEAVCGVTGDFYMPGFFSRMGAKRCPDCCKALRIDEGRGAPFNKGINA